MVKSFKQYTIYNIYDSDLESDSYNSTIQAYRKRAKDIGPQAICCR